MSVTIQRSQIVDIACGLYDGNLEIESYLSKQLNKKPIPGFFNKIEDKLWRMVVQEHPWKDFSGDLEAKTRGNILRRICTVLKSKCLNFFMKVLALFR